MARKIFCCGDENDGIAVFEEEDDCHDGDSDSSEEYDDYRKRFRYITIEPVVMLFFIAHNLMSTLRTEYVTDRTKKDVFLEETLNMNRDLCTSSSNILNVSSSDILQDAQDAQAEAAYWLLMYNLVELLPSVFVSPLIGAWSDRVGRKKAMIVPAIGYLIGTAIWIIIIYLDAAKSYLIIPHFVFGVSGDFPTLFAVCSAYLNDIAKYQSQIHRMIIFGVLIEFVTGISQIATGFGIYYTGFLPPFWIVFAALLTGIFYITVMVEEPHPGSSEKSSLFSPQLFDDVCALFVNMDTRIRTPVVLYLVVLGMHMMILHSAFLLVLLYSLNYPLCWTSITVGFYVACSLLLGSVGTLLGGRLFTGLVCDLGIAQIGMWSSLGALAFVAFGNSTAALFVSAIFGSFRFLTSPAMRSSLSQLVPNDKQGVLMASASCVESFGSLIGPSLFNLIYSLTLARFRGFTFTVMALLYVPLSVLLIYFQWIHKENRAPPSAHTCLTGDHEPE